MAKSEGEVVMISDDDEVEKIFAKIESPIAVVKRPMEVSSSRTLMEFINEVWISDFSATKNLRLIIAYFSKILATPSDHGGVESGRRRRECVEMRSAVMDLLTAWVREGGPVGDSCSKDTLQRYIAEYRSKRLSSDKVDPFLILALPKDRTMFIQMAAEYKDYVANVFDRVRAKKQDSVVKIDDSSTSKKRKSTIDPEEEEEEEEEEAAAVDEPLFDSSIFAETEKRRLEDSGNLLQQFMIKTENDGTLHAWRTPGEIGNTVIRIEVYRMKDVIKKEKRTWWKTARLRAQFLSQDSCPRKLTELLNEVANRMAKVPGLAFDKRNV